MYTIIYFSLFLSLSLSIYIYIYIPLYIYIFIKVVIYIYIYIYIYICRKLLHSLERAAAGISHHVNAHKRNICALIKDVTSPH